MSTKTKPAPNLADHATETAAMVSAAEQALAAERERLADVERELLGDIPARQRENRAEIHQARHQANAARLEELDEERKRLIHRNNVLVDERQAQQGRVADAISALRAARIGPPMDVAASERAMEEAAANLRALEDEQAGIQRAIRDAIAAGDVLGIMQSRARADVLPTHLSAARMALWRAEALHFEAQAAAAPDAIAAAEEALEPLRMAVREAEERLDAAVQNVRVLSGQRDQWRLDAREKRRRIAALIEEEANRNVAPVVRSLRHTPRAG